jgi:MFS family permease
MRRPWLVGGLLGTLAGLCLIGSASHLTGLLVGWCLTQTCFNALLGPLAAILPDQVPVEQRAMVGGLMGTCSPLSIIIGSGLAQLLVTTTPFWMMVTPAALGIAPVLCLVAMLDDKRLRQSDISKWSTRRFIKTFFVNPRAYPDFTRACAAVFLVSMALMSFTTYEVYFIEDYLQIPQAEVPRATFLVNLILNLVSIVTSFGAGWLADRYHKRKFIMVSAAVLGGTGLCLIMLVKSLPQLFMAGGVIGIALGLFWNGQFTLPSAVLPDGGREDAAKGMGLAHLASLLPVSLVPSYVPFLLATGRGNNYPLLFESGVLFALAAIPIVVRIRGIH